MSAQAGCVGARLRVQPPLACAATLDFQTRRLDSFRLTVQEMKTSALGLAACWCRTCPPGLLHQEDTLQLIQDLSVQTPEAPAKDFSGQSGETLYCQGVESGLCHWLVLAEGFGFG